MSEETTNEEMNGRLEQIERRMDDDFRAVNEQFAEQHAYTKFCDDRLDKALQAVSCGIARLERKLDRMLALIVESRGRR